jgi:hypothetical protein
MAWDKLITKYLNLPYRINKPYLKSDNNALVGKGSIEEIITTTQQIAEKQKINLSKLSDQEIYNFRKKNQIGIDCSGLICNLFGLKNKRKINADMLTSLPLSKAVNIKNIKKGDLIRQKNGQHVVLITKNTPDFIEYIHSSRKNRGVKIEKIDKNNLSFFKEGAWRLISLQ